MRGDGASTRVISTSADGQVNKLEFTGLDGLLYYEINLGNSVSTKHLYLGRSKLVDVEGSSVTYYHSDPTGSPLAATAADGALLWRTSYRPFGEKLAGATTKNQQWFTGKPFEDKIGLSYFGARWYDSVLGRFMAIDPVDWVDSNPVHSFNRYAYANNNPLRFVDPDGRLYEAVVAERTQQAIANALIGGVARAVAARLLSNPLTVAIALAAYQNSLPDPYGNIDNSQNAGGVAVLNCNSAILERNLTEATGVVKGRFESSHHVVAVKDNRAEEARNILHNAGMSVNDPNNGLFVNTPYHRKMHTRAYYDAVNTALRGASTYQDVAARLSVIKAGIISGTFP